MLFERGEVASALAYVLASVLLSLGAVFAGIYFIRSVG
jgi:fluoride ion exporter CrcB/FEX